MINEAKKKQKLFFKGCNNRQSEMGNFFPRLYIPIFTVVADRVFYICVFHSCIVCFPVDPDPHSPVCLKYAAIFIFFFIVILTSGHGDI